MPHLLSLPLNPSPLQSQFSNLLQSQPLPVTFSDNQSAFLSPASPLASAYARIIDHLQQTNHPVYVETDEVTNIITRLCVPEAARVWEIDNTDEEEVFVSLYTSSSIYSLARSHPEFQNMFDALQAAMENDTLILLTATMHRFEIVDVRALPAYMEEKELLQTRPVERVYPVDSKPITPERAEQLFKMMEAVSCNPPYKSNEINKCIPFKYPGGGCNIRAHLMSFLLLREKEIPEKIWSEGFMLTAHTMNDPNCSVSWSWHVAVTLLVKHTDSDEPEKMVFDPSLFDKPVPVAVWTFAQGKKLRSIKFSPWTWYERFGKEADEAKANSEMEKYRGFLDALWAKHGPSPYENCRIK